MRYSVKPKGFWNNKKVHILWHYNYLKEEDSKNSLTNKWSGSSWK